MELPMIVSTDDHVVEPAHLWQSWLPAKFRERGPRVERRGVAGIRVVGPGPKYAHDFDPSGRPADCWVFEDLVFVQKRTTAAVGFAREEMSLTSITYDEMRPGCYDPKARLEDMDVNWVEASLCFPTFPRFCGQTFHEATSDRELGLACVEAYNNWMVEEWCGDSGGRLVPLCLVPLWDADLAAAEVRRNAARGTRAVAFSEIPPFLGLPSIHSGYWNPFFEACDETGTVVCMHIGSSSRMPSTSPDAPHAVNASVAFNNAMASMSDYLWSGLMVRYPNLKLAYSESQIGWIPFLLERIDAKWRDARSWLGDGGLPEPPSHYYHNRIFGCFFDDRFGVRSRHDVGIDNITFETDYPHTDSTWPNTREVAERLMAGVPDDEIYKIMRGNAIRMLDLDLDRP
ncbi:amidohydrolase family protein [Frankia sp. QA3]|uniref:amidohydrolase family protein n=1 Tax=Frankia sp. QA3 TaxID=710111 RepID=UPI000269CFA9|nr:putative TIM-barrel fold metal-dependent hydrolase [Frankia sp. QA3]